MESGGKNMNVDEANIALDAVASAKRSVAAACAAPLWRHIAFGFAMALVTVAAGTDGSHRWIPFAASMALAAALVVWDRKQTGMFVNGYRAGRTLPVSIALLIAMMALAILAVRLESIGEPILALLPSVAAFVVAGGASLWWERIFLAELGAKR